MNGEASGGKIWIIILIAFLLFSLIVGGLGGSSSGSSSGSYDSHRCAWCKGTGKEWSKVLGIYVACSHCHGSGVIY